MFHLFDSSMKREKAVKAKMEKLMDTNPELEMNEHVMKDELNEKRAEFVKKMMELRYKDSFEILSFEDDIFRAVDDGDEEYDQWVEKNIQERDENWLSVTFSCKKFPKERICSQIEFEEDGAVLMLTDNYDLYRYWNQIRNKIDKQISVTYEKYKVMIDKDGMQIFIDDYDTASSADSYLHGDYFSLCIFTSEDPHEAYYKARSLRDRFHNANIDEYDINIYYIEDLNEIDADYTQTDYKKTNKMQDISAFLHMKRSRDIDLKTHEVSYQEPISARKFHSLYDIQFPADVKVCED